MIFILSPKNTLHLDKLEAVDFKYDNNFFEIPAQKYTNKAFLVSNLGVFTLSQYLKFDKSHGAYWQIWENSTPNYPNKEIFVLI